MRYNQYNLRFVVSNFSFIECVKNWDWVKCGDFGKKIVKKKFEKEWEIGLWMSYRKLRSFNKDKCTCPCLQSCKCSKQFRIFEDEEDLTRTNCRFDCSCPCECYYNLSCDNIKVIARCMKDWGDIECGFGDFEFCEGYEGDRTKNFNWFDNFLIELFGLSESDIIKLSEEYASNKLTFFAQSFNLLRIMRGAGSLSYSN